MQFDVNTIRNLEQLFGSPLYVFDEVDFTENYRRFEKTFQNVYPEYCVSYSYKTNYTPYICKLINQLGGYAEVVSGITEAKEGTIKEALEYMGLGDISFDFSVFGADEDGNIVVNDGTAKEISADTVLAEIYK